MAWKVWLVVVAGGCGGGGSSSALDAAGDAPVVDASPDALVITANRAFVTSTTTPIGSLGSLANADAICATRASAAGLPGTYRAWLSTTTVDAASRLAGARGWVRVDGRPFTDTVAALTSSGRVWYPLRLDEFGNDVGSAPVATATGPMGTRSTSNSGTCNDFTSTTGTFVAGRPDAGTSSFTEGIVSAPCANAYRLYCFQVDLDVPVEPAAVGRFAFIAGWTTGGGIATADAACQATAVNAGRTGTFRALIGTSTASAVSRFSAGAPWVRYDGVAIAPTASQLLAGLIDAPILKTAIGGTLGDYVTTGGTLDQPSTMSCADWTATTGTSVRGHSEYSGPYAWTNGPAISCSLAGSIYCLEE